MEFTCKARYIASGNLAYPPDNFPTYTSVLFHESVHILFLIAALYNIEVLLEDISNAILNS